MSKGISRDAGRWLGIRRATDSGKAPVRKILSVGLAFEAPQSVRFASPPLSVQL